MIPKKMPRQKPGCSKQDYPTPREFLKAVGNKFGVSAWAMDLAADASNSVSPRWLGPGGEVEDSLAADWPLTGDLWLNPPYEDIEPWVKKCRDYSGLTGQRIFLLVPASVGSNWFANYVWDVSAVYFVGPRLSFDGKSPYPKDCILAVYGANPMLSGCWRWRK